MGWCCMMVDLLLLLLLLTCESILSSGAYVARGKLSVLMSGPRSWRAAAAAMVGGVQQQ